MVESMTGFGRAQAQADGYAVETEIRSVNNRYCDVNIKLPSDFVYHEPVLRSRLQQKFGRGKISVTIKLEQTEGETPRVFVNEDLASAYHQMLSRLGTKLGLSDGPNLSDLLSFNDIFVKDGLDEERQKQILARIDETVDEAARLTVEMRRTEGEALATDLLERIDSIEKITEAINASSGDRVTAARQKLQERVSSLLDDESYDKERLELEIALLADKLDITEEIVRLNAHLKFFREALQANASSGRKLNFLMQEMLREINTIGSKAYDAAIAHQVVEVKEVIEIIREQIQNLV